MWVKHSQSTTLGVNGSADLCKEFWHFEDLLRRIRTGGGAARASRSRSSSDRNVPWQDDMHVVTRNVTHAGLQQGDEFTELPSMAPLHTGVDPNWSTRSILLEIIKHHKSSHFGVNKSKVQLRQFKMVNHVIRHMSRGDGRTDFCCAV